MKFSDLLGEPEPEETPAVTPAGRSGEPVEPDPISVFAPVPMPDRNPPPASVPPVPPPPSVPPVPPPASVPPVPPPPDPDATIPAVPPVPPIVNPPLDPPPVPVAAAPTPAPVAAPAPGAAPPPSGRSDLASLNVHQPAPPPEASRSSVMDQLAGLDEVVDDLLPSRRNRR